MEHEHTCKSLTAVYHEDKFAFGSSHKVEFNITRSAVIKVSIEQYIRAWRRQGESQPRNAA